MSEYNPYDYPEFSPVMDETDPKFYDECMDQKYPPTFGPGDENVRMA